MFSNKFSTINLTHLPYFVPVCQLTFSCPVVLSVTVELTIIDIQKHSFIVASVLELFQPLKLPAYG